MALGAGPDSMMVFRTGMLLTSWLAPQDWVFLLDALDGCRAVVFGITASDPATYATVLLVSLGAALLACSIPARRAEWIRWLRSGMNRSYS